MFETLAPLNKESNENAENASEKYFHGRMDLLKKFYASQLSDNIPGLGLFKMATESITGKMSDGTSLSRTERFQKGLVTCGSSLAGALQSVGVPTEGLIVGNLSVETAANLKQILQQMKGVSEAIKEKYPKASLLLSRTANYIDDEQIK